MHLAEIPANGFVYSIPLDRGALAFTRFISSFIIFGAIAFHFFVLARMKLTLGLIGTESHTSDVFGKAEHRTASLGIMGALLLIIYVVGLALRKAHLSNLGIFDSAVLLGPQYFCQLGCAVLLAIAFVFAFSCRWPELAWGGAALIGAALTFRGAIFDLKWEALVSSLHEIAASLWLGTLGVLVVAGLPAILRSPIPRERQGALVSELVAQFSPLALWAALLTGVTGIIASWIRLKYISTLWTMPIGYALDAKLAAVIAVVIVGAWNWRRLKPQLGTVSAAHLLWRSSIIELGFTVVVLFLTVFVAILPGPKSPSKTAVQAPSASIAGAHDPLGHVSIPH